MAESKEERKYLPASVRLINYDGTFLGRSFYPDQQSLNTVRNFRLRADSIIVSSMMKSGTTWVMQIVCALVNSGGEKNVEEKFHVLDIVASRNQLVSSEAENVKLIKSHLPYHLLPSDIENRTGKVIYVARNPKDVIISLYYFKKEMRIVPADYSFNDYFQDFLEHKYHGGPWLNNVLGYWQHRNDDNVLFLTYEQLHQDTASVVKRIAEFIGLTLTDEKLNEVIRVSSFSHMKDHYKTQQSIIKGPFPIQHLFETDNFFRKGTVGDWRSHMSEEQSDQVDQQMLEPLKQHNLFFN